MSQIHEVLKETFGYNSFRNNQETILNHILSKEKTQTLVVMPTGGGKSLLYQIPSIISDELNIVISPLISLMQDQVMQLKARGINAEFWNSSQTQKESKEVINKIQMDEVHILYVSPEKIQTDFFMSVVRDKDIDVLAVDEAHCISQWGHDFRPAYKSITKALPKLEPKKIIALTATANKKVKQDIQQTLNFSDSEVFVTGFARNDLRIKTKYFECEYEGNDYILKSIEKIYDRYPDWTGIVYTITRRHAEGLSQEIEDLGISSYFYHGDMKDKVRTEIQNKWMDNGGVMVATNAFGMGIDKSDVRFVMNAGLPSSIEEWYQMIGRGSRDGKGCLCLSTISSRDIQTRNFLIEITYPPISEILTFKKWVDRITQHGDNTMKIKQSDMAECSGVNSSMISGCCRVLMKNGCLTKIKRGHYTFHKKDIFLDLRKHEEMKEEKKDNFIRVYNLMREEEKCKMRMVCEYFGDLSTGDCGVCDVCKGKNKS